MQNTKTPEEAWLNYWRQIRIELDKHPRPPEATYRRRGWNPMGPELQRIRKVERDRRYYQSKAQR